MTPPSSRPWRFASIAFGILLLSGCHGIFYGTVNARQASGGVLQQRNVVFDRTTGLALDVYSPVNAAHAPVVVFFYGGSWKNGNRAWYRWMGEALAAKGIVAIVPDYRLWPTVRMDEFMRDSAHAVAWARDNAALYGGDPHSLFVMGHSAGGHIAALLATDARWLGEVGMKPRDLAGFIGLAGAYDFLPLDEDDYIDMFGHTAAEQARSQSINFVDGDEPPMLLLQGESDGIVEPSNAISLEGRMREQGEPVDVRMYPGTGHMGLLFSFGPWTGKSTALPDTLSFIHAHVAH
ncbi:acetyl esterase/lipase [Luteibacter rhizovicinus]|uniref:Acetyl esterase/lipase n=1 Tax=Luteibacter rhizovicinus TaxID=242606 RepID=A0A4R3YSD3_9GAMM|nr:alpha/beta hydrolase [Luteibacter rhizovicinus]TCV93963.1 acetyl esterase/lipase [Luteibacter rhizovicinus]